MDVVLGQMRAQVERPQTLKFAWPLVIFPELFNVPRHLTIMAGHLVSLGWEVYLPDAHSPMADRDSHGRTFAGLVSDISAALGGLGSIITVGHGFGGLLALKLAEAPQVLAAVALAPSIPGFPSPLLRRRRRWRFWRSDAVGLPPQSLLAALVSEAEPFQRRALINALGAADTCPATEVARGEVEFDAQRKPRLIMTGDADVFVPSHDVAQFAVKIGAHFISLPGRGHWLVGGRMLERTIAHMQRFLVRALGEELLLLYQEPDDREPDL
jgi:pimeloyl-ACP methyl ester carboxylesterase